MEEFTIMLNGIEDSYYDFVAAVLCYVKKKKGRLEVVEKYISDHPKAQTSDILNFISNQQDFYEDAAYARADAV